MIILDDNYRIEPDGRQWMLYREGKLSKKGVPMKLDCTYHPTLPLALKWYSRLVEARKLSGGYLSLGEAIKASSALLDRLDEIVSRINMTN